MKWYEEIFSSEDPARFERYIESDESKAQVDFIEKEMGLERGSRILDLCCGRGRHLIELTRRGYDSVGLDLSKYMLKECEAAASVEGLRPQLVCADMREPCFKSEFDAVVNLFTSFGYLESDEEDQKVLDAVSCALKPGGEFLIDLLNRDFTLRHYQPQEWQENGRGDITIAERHFNPLTGRSSDREVTICSDGRKIERNISLRFYTYNELVIMLQAAGMSTLSVHGDFDSSEFTINSPRMIILARKVI